MIVVMNKIDLNSNIQKEIQDKNILYISAKQKDGIDQIITTL